MSVNASLRPFPSLKTLCIQCRRISSKNRISRSAALRSTNDVATPLSSDSGQTADDAADAPPRWARTNPRLRAPVRIRPSGPNTGYTVNEDPKRLDAAYRKMLGPGGDQMLTENVKWLAVTHKSFDHGARGFNERLGFLGKRIVDLQLSLAMLNHPRSPKLPHPEKADKYGRVPFRHPALNNVENVNIHLRERALEKRRLAQLAQDYGLAGVIRWKPKQVDNLQTSGIEFVLAQTMYAIVGAVALQKGGEVAKRIVRQTILQPLGVA